jgi:hypothetical protein
LIIVSIVLFVKNINLNKDNNNLTSLVQQLRLKATTYTFEKDMEFLQYLIGYKCNMYVSIYLDPIDKIRSKIINGDELDEAVETIVTDIEVSMSESYRNTLHKYFYVSQDEKHDMLTNYITEIVLDTMTKVINEKNGKKMRSWKITENLESNKETIFGRHSDIDEPSDSTTQATNKTT